MHRRPAELGASFVEFSLAVVTVLMLFLGIFELARYLADRAELEQVAQKTLTYAAVVSGLEDTTESNGEGTPTHSQVAVAKVETYARKLAEGIKGRGDSKLEVDPKLILPSVGPNGSLKESLNSTPLEVTFAASFKPLVPFLPTFRFAVKAVGYREYQSTSSLPFPLDVCGRSANLVGVMPASVNDCPCSQAAPPATINGTCPPNRRVKKRMEDGYQTMCECGCWDGSPISANGTCPCAPGLVEVNAECVCDPGTQAECIARGAPWVWVPSWGDGVNTPCSCVQCNAGSTWLNSNSCSCPPRSCPNAGTFKYSGRNCRPDGCVCPGNMNCLNPNANCADCSCRSVYNCGPGGTFDSNGCICSCGPGYEPADNYSVCVPKPTPTPVVDFGG